MGLMSCHPEHKSLLKVIFIAFKNHLLFMEKTTYHPYNFAKVESLHEISDCNGEKTE
jgi:hypothetical protein